MKNYYNILGLPENASDKAITEAYKKLAIKFHPDKNEGDLFFADRFKQVNEAYQVLAKKEDKKEYDEMLLNYSDAYEILKQQQHIEYSTRSVSRKKNIIHKKSKYSWWMIGCVAITCASVLFWLNDSDSKGSINTPLFVNELDSQPEIVEVATQPLPQNKLAKEVVTSNTSSTKPALKQLRNALDNEKTPAPIIVEKQTISLEGRSLQSSEINQIISQLQTKNSNKGVRVTQSFNSDIQKDFAIVSILQKNGFVIAGRSYTTQNFEGIQINETSDYLNLIIGKTVKN